MLDCLFLYHSKSTGSFLLFSTYGLITDKLRVTYPKDNFKSPLDSTKINRKKGEADLYRDLFGNKRYNKWIRPVADAHDTVKVYFELYIAQLIKIDEVSQIMETKLWLKQRWFDFKLQWNYSEYDNIKKIRIPSENLWKPDIVLYNTAMGDFQGKLNPP